MNPSKMRLAICHLNLRSLAEIFETDEIIWSFCSTHHCLSCLRNLSVLQFSEESSLLFREKSVASERAIIILANLERKLPQSKFSVFVVFSVWTITTVCVCT